MEANIYDDFSGFSPFVCFLFLLILFLIFVVTLFVTLFLILFSILLVILFLILFSILFLILFLSYVVMETYLFLLLVDDQVMEYDLEFYIVLVKVDLLLGLVLDLLEELNLFHIPQVQVFLFRVLVLEEEEE